MKLKDKVVLITGASRGIGKATALLFAKEGARVVVNYIKSDKKANDVVKEIIKNGGAAISVKADVSDEKQVKLMTDSVIKRFGRIDILVNTDVHLLLLGVRRRVGEGRAGEPEVVQAELQEALREDPLQPLALLRTRKDPAALKEALRRSTAARPADALGWALLGESLRAPQEAAEREAAYRKAVALEPDSPTMSAALAWHLVQAGRPAEAWPLATFAADAVPWSARNLMTLAMAAAGSDGCDQALEARRRALALAAPLEAAGRGALRQQGEVVEARCGAGGAPR